MKKQIEILAPAGSYESLKAAIAAGADAVYIGGTRFGARAFADNLTEEKLLEAIDYVHLHGRKIYLTINTLLKEQEIDELYDYLLPYYKQGIDAVIIQDLGVLHYIRKCFPNLPVHASTQMTITNVLAAKFMESLGVERIVTSREMNINEVKEISEKTKLEIESFVHGALCYCYSGQCLYSSLIGGRSGNRGQCAQPCRLPYKTGNSKNSQYILSLKDMCTLESIPQLIESGIHSFKIEGRMKKPEYVALVTKMYRKYVDLYFDIKEKKVSREYKVDPSDKEKLLDLYNRGGSHGGYYFKKNGREMISIERPNHAGVPALKVIRYNGKELLGKALVDIMSGDVIEFPASKKEVKIENYTFANHVKKGQNVSIFVKSKLNLSKDMLINRTRNESLIREINEKIINTKIKEKINGKLILSEGLPAKLEIKYNEIEISVLGEAVQTAKNQPVDTKTVERQIRKTGNTEFEFEHVDIQIVGNVFVPMQNLNELRRSVLEILETKVLSLYRRENVEKYHRNEFIENRQQKTEAYVYVEELEQLKPVLATDFVKRIYLDVNALKSIWSNDNVKDVIDAAHKAQKEIYIAFPHIFRSHTIKIYENHYITFMQFKWDGVLIRNLETYMFLKEHDYKGKMILDHNVYHFNQFAKQFWQKEKIDSFTAPYELNYKELKELDIQDGELIIYGYQPMMVTAQCITNTTKGCTKKKGTIEFTDRYNKRFTAKNLCDYCYNIIYNTSPLALFDQKQEIELLNPKALRLQFTIENVEEVEKVLKLYEDIFVKNNDVITPSFDFTRGHFKRGIK